MHSGTGKSRPWDQTDLVVNSIEKIKPGFLRSLMCIFSESNETKILISQLTTLNEVPSWTARPTKANERNGVINLVLISPFWVTVRKIN